MGQGETSVDLAGAGVLKGARGLVMGVANNRSIAYGIARAARAAGAEIAMTFQGEALEKRVRPLAAQIEADVIGELDVNDDAQIASVFAALKRKWDGLDLLVHAEIGRASCRERVWR